MARALLEHLDAAHAGHALVADDQGDGLVAGLELGQGVERGLAAGGAHDAVGGPILAAQVLDHGFQHAYVVVNRQKDGPSHKESVEPDRVHNRFTRWVVPFAAGSQCFLGGLGY